MTSPGVGSGALLAAWFFLATNSLRTSSDFSAETASVALIWESHRRIDTDKTDTANLLFGNSYSNPRTTNRTSLAARKPTDAPVNCASRGLHLANVKDEPRRRPARFVPHCDSESVISSRRAFGCTKRDGRWRWLWRLVGRLLHFREFLRISSLAARRSAAVCGAFCGSDSSGSCSWLSLLSSFLVSCSCETEVHDVVMKLPATRRRTITWTRLRYMDGYGR